MAGAAAWLALGFAAAAAAAPVVYRVEPEFTYAEFAVSHIGLSRQRGHFGRTAAAATVRRGRAGEGRRSCVTPVRPVRKSCDFVDVRVWHVTGSEL